METNNATTVAAEGQFKRAPVRRSRDHPESLLTMALQSHSEDEDAQEKVIRTSSRRRRSIASNFSLASTAELTCDTGITTPARTSSPSPRRSSIGFRSLIPNKAEGKRENQTVPPASTVATRAATVAAAKPTTTTSSKEPAVQALEKKRCISFACAAKPIKPAVPAVVEVAKPTDMQVHPAAAEAPKRPCIRFACGGKPSTQQTTPKDTKRSTTQRQPSPAPQRTGSPATLRKQRSPSTAKPRYRSSTPRRSVQSPTPLRCKKYLTADTKDLQSECSRFHAFASDTPQEDDWIREDVPVTKHKMTIDDTLEKENKIRKLGKEAEEEAQMEEEANDDADETPNGEEGENDEDGDDNDEEAETDLRDDLSGYGSDDDYSDGYHSDNEGGDSDSDAEDEKDELRLWTLTQAITPRFSDATPVYRQPSFGTSLSDSSRRGQSFLRPGRLMRSQRPVTPELPDSTDFVCGTLDEDRPLEDAYASRVAAKKSHNVRTIPQDIDPSFPTSDPEDEDDRIRATAQESEDQLWLHGEIEDLHHGQDGAKRKKSLEKPVSPKRRHSPAPQPRGRSPAPLFDRQPFRQCHSPAPLHNLRSPPASPVHFKPGHNPAFKALAFRPGLTHTKSLPRTPAVAPPIKCRRGRSGTLTKEKHVRGAVDIVLGLEQKRQRRKEKCYQKHCNRARKGQVAEKRPLPGKGAERMKELGLLMAGKLQGNYVLSI